MTSDDAGRELYSHQTPPTEWGCIIETPEGRHVRTDYDRWPWSGEGGAAGEHSDDYIARIGWRLARLERDVFASIPAATIRAALAGVRCPDWPAETLAVADVVAERDRLLLEACQLQRVVAGAGCGEECLNDDIGAVWDLLRERDRLLAGGCARDQRTTQWCAEAQAVRAERDALRRIVGEVDLALSGAPASGQWGPRALSVYDLMDAIDADDYSDADDAVRCAQAMAAVVRDVARERIAAERDGGAP